MRQVGDRLIPVGVTSGRVHALPGELGGTEIPEGGSNGGGSSRRSRRRQQNELANIIGGMAGPDLEEVRILLIHVLSSFYLWVATSLWSWKRCGCRYLNTRSTSDGNGRLRRAGKMGEREAATPLPKPAARARLQQRPPRTGPQIHHPDSLRVRPHQRRSRVSLPSTAPMQAHPFTVLAHQFKTHCLARLLLPQVAIMRRQRCDLWSCRQ